MYNYKIKISFVSQALIYDFCFFIILGKLSVIRAYAWFFSMTDNWFYSADFNRLRSHTGNIIITTSLQYVYHTGKLITWISLFISQLYLIITSSKFHKETLHFKYLLLMILCIKFVNL